MKVTGISSGFSQKRGQGKQAYVNVFLEAESTAERAMMAMATAGTMKLYVYNSGNAELQITMPRAKK